jgi:hypothetical protein
VKITPASLASVASALITAYGAHHAGSAPGNRASRRGRSNRASESGRVTQPSFFLLQNALASGNLVASQPGFTLTNPLVSVAFGLAVFGEHGRGGLFLLGAIAGAVLIGGRHHHAGAIEAAGSRRRPARETLHLAQVTTGYVTAATLNDVTEISVDRWVVLVVRVPAAPSRHRVAVWRELRRIGALSLGQGAWVAPDVPVFSAGITRVIELAERGEGEVVVLQATGRGDTDAARLAELFTAERAAEWTEFLADCGKFDAEIDKEIGKGKFTLAELEEEEQSLERLRRWHRDLKARDVYGAPTAAEADQQLKHCTERLADYTERVFAALHQM